MIAKGISISHGSSLVNYLVNKPDAEIVRLNGLSIAEPQQIWMEMGIDRMAHHVKNDTLSLVISPTVEESRGWTMDDWQRLLDDFLRRFDGQFDGMVVNNGIRRDRHGKPIVGKDGKPEHITRRLHSNLGGSQFVCVLHHDSDTPHLQLAINRIDRDGRVNSDSKIGERCAAVANEIARERGYRQAEDVGKDARAVIARDCRETLARMERFSFDEYAEGLRRRGYEVKVKNAANGKVVGYTIAIGNSVYKASEIDRQLTPSRLLRTWQGLRFGKARERAATKTPHHATRSESVEPSVTVQPTLHNDCINVGNTAGVLLDIISTQQAGGVGGKVNDPQTSKKRRRRRGLGF